MSDLGPACTGTIGIAPSGNINPENKFPSLFEPVHGSAPKHAGQNKVNPIASINSIQMMMDWLGRKKSNDQMVHIGKLIDESVADHLKDGKNLTYDLGGKSSCSFVGESISSRLADKLAEQF